MSLTVYLKRRLLSAVLSANVVNLLGKRFSGFCPLIFFEHNYCPLRGGGVPPLSVKEKFRQKTTIFGQKTLILALFDPFFLENVWRFSVKGGAQRV